MGIRDFVKRKGPAELGNFVLKLTGVSRKVNEPAPNPELYAEIAELFATAENSIKIVSGGLSQKFYLNDHEGVANAISQAIERGREVQIIGGPEAAGESLQFWASQGAKVYQLDEWPPQHFALVDDKHVRLEDPHPQENEKKVQYIVYNFKDAGKYERKFEKLKKQAKRYKPEPQSVG